MTFSPPIVGPYEPHESRSTDVVEAELITDLLDDLAQIGPAIPGFELTSAEAPTALPAAVSPRPVHWLGTARWKLQVVAILAASCSTLVAVQHLLGDRVGGSAGRWQDLVELVWILPFTVAVLNVAGMLLQRRPSTREATAIGQTVVFRYVSRGQNRQALADSVESVHDVMSRYPLFPYRVEAVVDRPVDLDPHPLVTELVVPADYRTEHGALFKARALQYAVEVTGHADDVWIFHGDEESHVTPSLIRGIADAVAEEESTGAHRVGQGLIVYSRTLGDKPVMTLADSVRVADDLGRWNLQNRIFGAPVFGMHGSFILVRNSIEQATGFDFGPQGSVTEDTWWGLLVMAYGGKTRWVDGVVVEQSPERLSDFVRQRQRWFDGLARVVRHCPVPLRYRAGLGAFVAVWAFAPLTVVATAVLFLSGTTLPPLESSLTVATFGLYTGSYVIGGLTTVRIARPGFLRSAALLVGQVVLMPLFALLEAAGVLAALVSHRGIRFHVIRKEH